MQTHVFFREEVHYKEESKPNVDDCEYNKNSSLHSGKEFFFDNALFRGKTVIFSRHAHPEQFASEQYKGKQSIIRLVGHTKKEIVDAGELFLEGYFDRGTRGFPRDYVLRIGMKIANMKSKHFFLSLNPRAPYVAAPLVALVDVLRIEPFHGRSSLFWQTFNLREPLQERWCSSSVELQQVHNPHDHVCSAFCQKQTRIQLRHQSIHVWPRFLVHNTDLFAFEFSDAAFCLEDWSISWSFANLFTLFRVHLTNYVDELPFSIFVQERKQRNLNQNKCETCNAPKEHTLSIPREWQHFAFCHRCFPPAIKDVRRFLVSFRLCKTLPVPHTP